MIQLRKRLAPVLAVLGHKSVIIAVCGAIALFLGALSAGTLMILHKKLPTWGALRTDTPPTATEGSSASAQRTPASTAGSTGTVAGAATGSTGEDAPAVKVTPVAIPAPVQQPVAPTAPTIPQLPVPPKPLPEPPLIPRPDPDGPVAPTPLQSLIGPLLSLQLQITL